MKIFIWIASFFVIVGIPNALIKELNGSFGAIPAIILSGSAFWTAKTLCNKWDKHKADKEKIQKTENTENTDTSESDYTVVAEISDIPKVEAEFVGTDDTKHSFKKLHIGKSTTAALIISSLLLASSVVGNIYQAKINTTLQNTIAKNENKIAIMQQDLATKNQNLLEYRDEIYELKNEIYELKNFYEKYIVVVPKNNSGTYHIYGCKHCNTSSSYDIYRIDEAKKRNYTPCNSCCKKIEYIYNFFGGNYPF